MNLIAIHHLFRNDGLPCGAPVAGPLDIGFASATDLRLPMCASVCERLPLFRALRPCMSVCVISRPATLKSQS
ncbi:hypothetical protein PHET_05308 [Paragonimus heterotremus]|uniref:Uncharacterized protein n=1 Tax=Paragonimus heterotremus TaxID=100268 RepID=A0A8J4WI79_9TREM|nr:hypothetical protein PHET_05308 [Paragonimus heterotremus]